MRSRPGTDRTSDGITQSNPPMVIVPIPSIGVNGSIGGTLMPPGSFGSPGVEGPPPPAGEVVESAEGSGITVDGDGDGPAERVGPGVPVGNGSGVRVGSGTRTVGRGSEGRGIASVGRGSIGGVVGGGVGVGGGGVGVGVAVPTVIVTVAGREYSRPSRARYRNESVPT
jgi:hypothetical protein